MNRDHPSQKIEVSQNQLIYLLDEQENTAGVIGCDESLTNVLIPKSIIYQDQEFIVKSINEKSFQFSKVTSVSFPPDSRLQSIGQRAFYFSPIQKLMIPPNLSELEEGWCENASKLTTVTIMEGNKHFKKIEEKLIFTKSDEKSDIFDILIFAERDVTSISIPLNAIQIASYAFSESKIEKVFIPPHITKI